jgi:hypothetical protein
MVGASRLAERANEWRHDAAVLRRYGQDTIAAVIEKLADDLEADSLAADQRVSFDEAVHLSGYSKGHLLRLVRTGKLRNVGTKRKPEFLLADLPRKPGHDARNEELAPVKAQPDISAYRQVARAVVQGE